MDRRVWVILRSVLIEVGVYGLLAALYFSACLRPLGGTLRALFDEHLTAYALAGLGLIVGQAVVLGSLISFLTDRLGLGRWE